MLFLISTRLKGRLRGTKGIEIQRGQDVGSRESEQVRRESGIN